MTDAPVPIPRAAEHQQAARTRPDENADPDDLDPETVRGELVDDVLHAGPNLTAPAPGQLHPEAGETLTWQAVAALLAIAVIAVAVAMVLPALRAAG